MLLPQFAAGFRLSRPVASFVLLSLCLLVTGCGSSGISEAELRKRAIVRPKDEDSAANDPAPQTKVAQAAGQANAPPPPPSVASERQSSEPQVASTMEPHPLAEDTANADVASNERPAGPLTEAERRARSIENLEKIGRAVVAYANKHGRMPTGGLPRDGELLLSWRVLILPELGYGDLYKRFKTNERWDSRHNKLLLDYIPPEYQSPERFDSRTNYLGVAGPGAAIVTGSLESLRDGVPLEGLKDGADNTLAVVEVDDKHAVEWTRPVDHVPQFELPFDKLGGLRGEGAFAAMASGRVVLLPREMPASRLAALFTVAGGEPIGAATFLDRPSAEPPPPTLATIADDPDAANQPLPSDEDSPVEQGTPGSVSLLQGSGSDASGPTKEAVPSEAELSQARELLKELYGEAYKQAQTRPQRQQLLKTLLDDTAKVTDDPADFYELARIARDLAAALGDTPSLLAACEMLEQRFELDALAMRLAALETLSQSVPGSESGDPAAEELRRIQREAFEADRYDMALSANKLLLKFSGVQGNKAELARLQKNGAALEAAQSLHAAAERGLQTLQGSPDDAHANEAVGRYLCLVKNYWDAGLPYLARAADIRLRGIASLDLDTHRSLHETLLLADQYWELAGRFKLPEQRGLHLRAVYGYSAVLPSLSGGLEKIRAQRRIDEAASLYGQAEIDRLIAPLGQPRAMRGLSARQ